jgi:hypothetical protein
MVGWIQCLDPTCAVGNYLSYGGGKQMKLFGFMTINRNHAWEKLLATISQNATTLFVTICN